MAAPWVLTARWIFPVDGPPLPFGTVTVRNDRILAVAAAGDRTADLDLGNAAVLPGLVNAHTHLDLSGLRGKVPPTRDFPAWLRAIISHRRTTTPDQVAADIRDGLAECLRYGTTLVGDISGDGSSWDEVQAAPLWSVVFRELLGLTEERAAAAWEVCRRWLSGLAESPTCRPGVSPHAPYSVRAALFGAVTTFGLPLAVHLAETPAEQELLAGRRGPFVSFLEEVAAWDPEGLVTSVQHILHQSTCGSPALFIHCNYLTADAPIPPNGSVVYCPRTHAAFGHDRHPFRDFLTRGVRVALGTDSLASNPDLDVLAEARFVHQRHPDLPGDLLLRMVTLAGAEALGWASETGSLTPGKSADLVVVPLPDEEAEDPHRLVLASSAAVVRTLWRGRWRGAQGQLGQTP